MRRSTSLIAKRVRAEEVGKKGASAAAGAAEKGSAVVERSTPGPKKRKLGVRKVAEGGMTNGSK